MGYTVEKEGDKFVVLDSENEDFRSEHFTRREAIKEIRVLKGWDKKSDFEDKKPVKDKDKDAEKKKQVADAKKITGVDDDEDEDDE